MGVFSSMENYMVPRVEMFKSNTTANINTNTYTTVHLLHSLLQFKMVAVCSKVKAK